MIKKYYKRHRLLLWAMLFLMILQMFTLYLVGAPANDVVYFLVLEMIILAVFAGIDFALYVKRVKELERLMEHPSSDQEMVEETGDALQDALVEMVRIQARDRHRVENEAGDKMREMAEYYNMWVHQIKTPISGMNVVLQSMEPDENVRELQNQLFSVEQYVDMALQYQRMQAEGKDFAFSEIALNTVIRENIRKYAKLFIGKKLAVKYEETNLTVLTDEKWLSFVMGQILTNAIKYSKTGAITISAWEETNFTYLSIKDQGIGISPEDLPRVFERGYTGYNGRANKSSTGIGLFLCKEVMKKLGHSIRIESEVGQGTEVILGFSKLNMDLND